jgi:hypothetical protein
VMTLTPVLRASQGGFAQHTRVSDGIRQVGGELCAGLGAVRRLQDVCRGPESGIGKPT